VIPPDSSIILLAVLLDLSIGDPYWLPHPVVGIGRLITWLDQSLRRQWLNERCAGIILLVTVVAAAGGAVFAILQILESVQPIAAWLCAILISATCLASRSLQRESARVASALEDGDLDSARHFLSYIVGRDTARLDEAEIWRAVVETVAENTSDGIIAPLFWLTVGGPVAAIAFKAVSTLDSMVGYKNPRYLSIGWASARMDDLLNYIPARLTVLLFFIVAPLAGCSASGALRIARRDRLNHPSPNSGHPEAAAAGALGVRFGGASSYHGVPSWKEYIGDALQPLDGAAYRGMIRLMYFTTLLMAVGCVAAAYFVRGFHVPFI
jgi:adenosylcobinamide-phosphate synthase